MAELLKKKPQLLIVDDDEEDVSLIRRSIKKAGIVCDINVARDGEEALDYLYHRNGFESSTVPNLILQDLNMPRVTGLEVLTVIRGDEKLRPLPVVMFTTSDQDVDILESYNLGVNAYLTKPGTPEAYLKILSDLGHFWFDVAKKPQVDA